MTTQTTATQTMIEDSLGTILSLTAQLEAAIIQENDSLTKMNHEKFVEIQSVKTNLAKNYEVEAQKLLLLRDKLKQADSGLRGRLLEAHTKFETVAEANMRALSTRALAVKKLNERIMASARKHIGSQTESYTADGLRAENMRKSVSAHGSQTA